MLFFIFFSFRKQEIKTTWGYRTDKLSDITVEEEQSSI